MEKKFSVLLSGLLCLSSTVALASTADDLAMIRKLLPPGYDIAQVQAGQILKYDATTIQSEISHNYLIRDFNQDGLPDLMVIVEKNPTFTNFDKNQPCASYDPAKGCELVYGPRSLQVYLGQPDGSYKLFLSNERIVLNGDDGGVFGDPLDGLSLNKRGSILLSVYGGSSWRWGHVDTIQYRGDDFYIIGETDTSVHNIEPETTASGTDVNLITGEAISYKNGGRRVKSWIRVKPLVKLRDFVSPMTEN